MQIFLMYHQLLVPCNLQNAALWMTLERNSISEIGYHRDYEIDIRDYKDWYSVPINEFRKLGGSAFLFHYRSMSNLLMSIYPEYP